jgi:hypothetical protein
MPALPHAAPRFRIPLSYAAWRFRTRTHHHPTTQAANRSRLLRIRIRIRISQFAVRIRIRIRIPPSSPRSPPRRSARDFTNHRGAASACFCRPLLTPESTKLAAASLLNSTYAAPIIIIITQTTHTAHCHSHAPLYRFGSSFLPPTHAPCTRICLAMPRSLSTPPICPHCPAASPATPPLLCTQHPLRHCTAQLLLRLLAAHIRTMPLVPHAALTLQSPDLPTLPCSVTCHIAAALHSAPIRHCTAQLLLRLLAAHIRTHAAPCPAMPLPLCCPHAPSLHCSGSRHRAAGACTDTARHLRTGTAPLFGTGTHRDHTRIVRCACGARKCSAGAHCTAAAPGTGPLVLTDTARHLGTGTAQLCGKGTHRDHTGIVRADPMSSLSSSSRRPPTAGTGTPGV